MAIYEFNGFRPVIKESSFVHPLASIIGNVIIGENVYVGPGAAIRGDWGQIIIEDGCNVQENCTIHMFPGTITLLKKGAHIGHGAIIHGGVIGENCLIGMNSVIMDDVIIEKESIIGASSKLSFNAADCSYILQWATYPFLLIPTIMQSSKDNFKCLI